MASNFFEQQDAARKKTGYLVALFALAVMGITLLIYAAVLTALVWIQGSTTYAPGSSPPPLPYVGALVGTLLGVLAVVGGCPMESQSQLPCVRLKRTHWLERLDTC